MFQSAIVLKFMLPVLTFFIILLVFEIWYYFLNFYIEPKLRAAFAGHHKTSV